MLSVRLLRNQGLGVGTQYKLEGTVEKFTSQSVINFQNGDVENLSYNNKNVKGELKASMSVKTNSADFGLKLPVTILKFPFLVGPIPVVLNVRMEYALFTQVPLGGHADVAATFTFDSETGFRYDGAELHAEGNVGSWSASTDTASSGAVGALAAVFTIGFPQVEVDVLAKSFVAYARPTFQVIGNYSVSGLDGSSCQTAKAAFYGVVGAKLSALGLVNFGEKQIQLWGVEKELLKEGKCD